MVKFLFSCVHHSSKFVINFVNFEATLLEYVSVSEPSFDRYN